ncbi:MAG: hypothetical protein F4X49_12715 [Acidimicrobiia bacterium]|nr:hypothetical protein [Acidimicrobiia bacterium]
MIRRGAMAVVTAVTAGVLAFAAPSVAHNGEDSAAASTLRIQARLLESGKVEFGLRLDGERTWLPRARLFPYPTAEVGRWLFSSPYTLSDATVARIQARLLASGKVEFGLQLDGDEVWLPRARLFPYPTAEVGRWLFSSPYTVPVNDESTVDSCADAEDRDCAPAPVGDAIVLYAYRSYGDARAFDNDDFEPYVDSGLAHDPDEYGSARSRPIPLEVGTRIVVHYLDEPDDWVYAWTEYVITGFPDNVERFSAWQDEVHYVALCATRDAVYYGGEVLPPEPVGREGYALAYRDDDGRYRLDLWRGGRYVGAC